MRTAPPRRAPVTRATPHQVYTRFRCAVRLGPLRPLFDLSTHPNPIDDRESWKTSSKYTATTRTRDVHEMHTQTLDHTHIATQTRGVKRRAAHAGGFLAFLALRPGWGAGGRADGRGLADPTGPHRPGPRRPRARAGARPRAHSLLDHSAELVSGRPCRAAAWGLASSRLEMLDRTKVQTYVVRVRVGVQVRVKAEG